MDYSKEENMANVAAKEQVPRMEKCIKTLK